MSDPVKNEEIEDVLSSIRRLVSESGGLQGIVEQKKARAVDAEDVPAEEPAAMDRLVLSPALRVAEAAPENVEPHEPQAEDASAPLVLKPDQSAEDSKEAEAAPQTDDAQTEETRAEEPVVEEALSEDANEDAASAAPVSLAERVARMEAEVSGQEHDWEDEEAGESDIAAQPVETLQWEDHESEAQSEGPSAAAFAAAAAEAAAQNKPEDGAALDGDIDEAESFDFLGDETVLDEEALREMVADIVRQELQGALGERITRNVRKLVRREIHRALMAQELD